MIHHGLADLMIHHLVSEAMPELEHLRSDATCNDRGASRK
jgi:hypothetical protein